MALSKLAQGSNAYDTAYDDAMDRIKGQISDQQDLAFRALSWIAFAKRPLTTLEFRHALGIELNETEFDEDNIPELEDVVSACCGLVTVDEKTKNIRLVHYTTQEYFERTHTTWLPDAHTEIMKTCVTYLSFDAFASGMCVTDSEFEKRLSLYPLYDYASHYWGNHAYSSSDCQYCSTFLTMDSNIKASTQAMFAVKTHHTTIKKGINDKYAYCQDVLKRVTGLHLAAYFGLYEAVKILLEHYNAVRVNDDGKMPASYAPGSGHGVVIQLPNKSVGPNAKDNDGKTPLTYASENGHEAVARLLLENNAKIDTNSSGRTPLSYAAQGGHEAVVRLLLKSGAEVDSEATRLHKKTPLSYAAGHGHEGVVKLLLKKGAVINIKSTEANDQRVTPLMCASANGHQAVAKLLLRNGAEVSSKATGGRNEGKTALSYAAQYGHEAVVRLLLKNGAETETEVIGIFGIGRTALSLAAAYGHEAVVRLLLKKGAKIDSKATKRMRTDMTARSFRVEPVHDAMVRLFPLKDHSIKPISEVHWRAGKTALSIAAEAGYKNVVQILLENGADIDLGFVVDTNPLALAAMSNHWDVVRLLIRRGAGIISDDKVKGILRRRGIPFEQSL